MLEWQAGYPLDEPDLDCVGLLGPGLKIANVPCDFRAKSLEIADPPEAELAYMCEARNLKSKSSNEACLFPFKFQGITYSSCSHVPIPDWNPLGNPWCATEVDENQNVIRNKWILCQDERTIIMDESGAGLYCPIPFLYDRIYYDTCTRTSHDGSPAFNEFYWCPDPRHLIGENGNEYNQSAPIGKCPDFLKPPGM